MASFTEIRPLSKKIASHKIGVNVNNGQPATRMTRNNALCWQKTMLRQVSPTTSSPNVRLLNWSGHGLDLQP